MQDWNVVTFRKKNTGQKKGNGEQKPKSGESNNSVKRVAGRNTQKAPINARKIEQMIDEGEGSMRIPTVDFGFSMRLQRARQAKGWTQKELAGKIAEKLTVINEYENGSAIPNGVIISKLERVLGVKLRGQQQN